MGKRILARLGIGGALTLAFGALAALTVLVVVSGFYAARSVTRDIAFVEATRAPASLTSAQAQASLLRMQLHVRGYLVLGDPQDIAQYVMHKETFEGSLASLRSLATTWNDDEARQVAELARDYARWVQLPQKLFELHDNPLKNREALRFARLEVQPRRVEVLDHVDAMIGRQKERELTVVNRELLSDLSGFQTSFDAVATNLMAYAASGEPSFKLSYGPQLATNAALWRALSEKRGSLSPEQREHLDIIAKLRAEVGQLALQIVEIVAGERAYEDLYLYRTEAAPQAQAMLRLLEAITTREQTGLQADLARARASLSDARAPAIAGGLLAIALAVALALGSQRRIVGPVRRLTEMAGQVAAGDLSSAADVESNDEIGRLARMINTRLRKEELQQLMASVSDCLWRGEIAADGTFMNRYISPAVERISGIAPERLLSEPSLWLERVHPEDRDALVAEFRRISSGAADRAEIEYRIVREDGVPRWVRDSWRAARFEDGRTVVNGVISDITERKHAEEALRVSEQRYALAMSAAEEGHWDWDIPKDDFWASPRLLEMYGFPPVTTFATRDDFLDRFAFHPEDRPKWAEAVAAHFAGSTARFYIEMRMLPRGEVRWIHVTGIVTRDTSGNPVRWTGAVIDITERKRMEEALRLSEERYALAMQAADDGHYDWDIPEDKYYASPRLLVIFGMPPDCSFSSRNEFIDALPFLPEDRPQYVDAVARHLAGNTTRFEMELRVVVGLETRWVHTTGICLRDPAGKPIRWTGCVTDISGPKNAEEEMKRLERQLARTQRLEALGTLAGGIAHDFNNILGAILGYGEMALRDASANTRLRRDVESMILAGERGRALVERILAFSRSGMGERVAVNVEEVVREALHLLGGTLPCDIKVETSFTAGAAAMAGDVSQVHQVLANLANNAVQAMPEGGTLAVTLGVETVETRRIATIGMLESGEYIVLAVADTGCGIAPAVLDRIFDPFFTTKEVAVGTGLGLSLVHGIVTEVGGAIDVTSTPGVGSRFAVYLPRCGEVLAPDEVHEPEIPRGEEQRILVVDDEDALVDIATRTLEELGYAPRGFNSSAVALAAFRERPADFDALITDERMPGLSGTELIREVRAIRPEMPVVLMSGYLSAAHFDGEDRGADAVLRKPVARRELAESLARVLLPVEPA